MKAISLIQAKKPIFTELPNPKRPKKGWITIKVVAAGVCGSDLQKFSSGILPRSYLKTEILGHEFSGYAFALGKGVINVKIGERVSVIPMITCKKCDSCKKGYYERCKKLCSIGKSYPGGFAEFVNVPANNVRPLQGSMSFIDGALLDIVAVAVHAYHLIGSPNKKKVLILGDGPVALLLTQLLTNFQNEVTVAGKHDNNLKIAKLFGAKVTSGHKLHKLAPNVYPYIFEAVGRTQSNTLNQAIRLIGFGGKICVLGVFEQKYIAQLNIRNLFYKEANLMGSNSYGVFNGRNEYDEALYFVKNKIIEPQKLVTHTFCVEDFQKAISCIYNKSSSHAIKIILTFA